MSNYSKTTDFEAKDSLPTGDSGKIIRGAEFETEFDAISTAIATKADTAGPTFTGTLTFETISDGTIGVTAFVDEDDMSSDSATLVPTQQSVKAYVDSQVTAQDLDFQADSGGALSIDLDSETMTFTGGTGIDTSGSGNAVTFAIDSTVATLTGTQTLTNKTLTAPTISGNLTTDGTIDGRDVATDGAKLDGIEAGATGDQTNAEIRAAVEAATDSNVFTDADHSKLDGIEASADVTDTANVTAAGALMDSELTSEASVKALNQGVATTDSPTFAAVTVNGNVEFDGLSGTGSVTVTDILDQDDMSSNSATALATQQSIKAYVDTTVAATNELVEDTTPQLGGDLDLNGNDITGTGNINNTGTITTDGLTVAGATTLTHSGTTLSVDRTGGATALIELQQASTVRGYLGADSTKSLIVFNGSAAEKFSVSNTGIDVTGTVTADGLTVDGNITNLNYGKTFFTNGIGTNKWQIWNDNGGTDKFQLVDGDGHLVLQAEQSGDISFYEDTGTTAKLFWDASAESLGIGVADPAGLLEVFDVLTVPARNTVSVANQRGLSVYQNQSNGLLDTTLVYGNSASSYLAFGHHNGTSYAERMRIDSSGNVGIGTSDPNAGLEVLKSGGGKIRISETADRYVEILGYAEGTANGSTMAFQTIESGTSTSTERMRVDSSGEFTLGNPSAGSALQLDVSATGTDGVDIKSSYYSGGYGPMKFHAGGSERMRIDSSGNTTFKTSAGHLSVEALGGGSVKLNSNGSMGMNVASGFSYEIDVGGTEAMRIDSNRNLLVGTTDTVPSNNGASGDAGVAISPDGVFRAARSGNVALDINRMDSDGAIADFRKDGTTVGSIQSRAGVVSTIILDPRSGQGAGLTGAGAGGDTLRHITPTNESGTEVNGKVSLGNSNNGFKDIYLSGGVVFGSTGGNVTSKTLDDYEEGTWTPTISSGSTSPTYSVQTGTYVKIGKQVFFSMYITTTGGTLNSSHLIFSGLPFSSTGSTGGASVSYSNSGFRANNKPTNFFTSGTQIEVYETDGSTLIGTEVQTASFDLRINGQYEVA